MNFAGARQGIYLLEHIDDGQFGAALLRQQRGCYTYKEGRGWSNTGP